VTHQGVGSLVRHFLYDLFHFDGKFFDTLKYLVIRPGWVPRQFVAGKRQSFLDPIRMYLFTSAVFFLVFFATNTNKGNDNYYRGTMTSADRYKFAAENIDSPDSTIQKQVRFVLDSNTRLKLFTTDEKPDRDTVFPIRYRGRDYLLGANVSSDSATNASLNKNWLSRKLGDWYLKQKRESNDDEGATNKKLLDLVLHKLPQILFISLPFFALLLKLLYIRRKNVYYSEHAVFTLYHYIFSFILLLVMMGISKLDDRLDWGIFSFLQLGLFLWGGVYLYLSMRRFYGQGRLKTLFKFLALNILGVIMMSVLFSIIIIVSLLNH